MDINPMDALPRLDDLGILYGTDKCSLGHGYLRHYERWIDPYRDRAMTLLEIGVARGHSLHMWEEYLPNASVVGIDIQSACLRFAGGRRTVEIGSQADPDFLTAMGTKYRPTIILDDGSHRADHIILSFESLYPYLADGGIYIVEDLHFHGGQAGEAMRGTAPISPLQYFRQLAALTVGPDADNKFNRALAQATDSVEFVFGAIAVRKKPAREADPVGARRALVHRSGKAEMWSLFCQLLLNTHGEISEALQAVETAIELDPQEPIHRFRLSLVMERVGDLPAAIAAARQAVAFKPQQRSFQVRLAELETRLRDLAET